MTDPDQFQQRLSPQVQQLVREVIDLTGADSPDLLADDSPALARTVSGDAGFYLVGLIGGKDVGKSSLVNALVGQNITAATSFGEGTPRTAASNFKDV